MSLISQKIEELKSAIYAELEYCNPADTPYVCEMITSSDGKKKVVDQIVEIVGSRGGTISMAISEIEWAVNPNNNE
jgi:hypothetical protein